MPATSPPLASALTDLGNIVTAGPVLVMTFAWLWHHRLQSVAIAAAVNAALVVACTILLKKLSQQTGGAFFDTPWHMTTGAPSGHAGVAAVVYGSLGALFASRGRGLVRVLGVALACAAMAGVDITRVTLGFHSPADVVCGVLLGSTFAALTWLVARASPGTWPPMLPLLAGLVVVAAVMHLTGLRFDSNAVL